MSNPSGIELSVVVVVVSDTVDRRSDASLLAGALEALARQTDPPALETIVPFHTLTRGIDPLRLRFPSVRFIPVADLQSALREVSGREHHDELRARGLAAANGDIVALLEDHGRPDPHWCRRTVEAHRSSYAGIGGAIENEVDRALNWAVYFCDFGRYQNPLSEGETWTVSDANVSYKRSALTSVRHVWSEAFREPAVNAALAAGGSKFYIRPDLVIHQNRGRLSLGPALRERFIWGRSYGVERARTLSVARRALYAGLSPVLPALLVFRMSANVLRKRRLVSQFAKALPFTLLLVAAWAWGEAAGYLFARLPDEA